MYNFTILSYWKKKKYARICSVNVHVTICPLIYIPCVHMPPIIIPPFDIPREYIWKKRNYPSDIFEFIFSKFIVFFLIFVYLLSLSVSYFFSKLFKKKKSFLVAPLSTLRNFYAQWYCVYSILSHSWKNKERNHIFGALFIFGLSFICESPAPTSRRKNKFGNNILSQNILEKKNHLLYLALCCRILVHCA